jgi:subtilase family serine protease
VLFLTCDNFTTADMDFVMIRRIRVVVLFADAELKWMQMSNRVTDATRTTILATIGLVFVLYDINAITPLFHCNALSKVRKESKMTLRSTLRSFSGSIWLVSAVASVFVTLPAYAQQSLQVLHNHVRPVVSSGRAALMGSLPSEQVLPLSIVLPLHNETDLDNFLSRLYDPSSPDYHNFLTVDQFTQRFGPTSEDYQSVVDFAKTNGFTVAETSPNRLVVNIRGSVAQIERSFNISMKMYQHPTESRTFFSPDREPTINLRVPVAHIAGLNNFDAPHSLAIRASDVQPLDTPSSSGSGPNLSYLPSDMRAAYYGGTSLTGSGQAVGLVEFDGYNIGDVVSSFYGSASSSQSGNNYTLHYTTDGEQYNIPINNVLLGGATLTPAQGYSEAEVVLDIAQPIGMAPGLSQVLVYIAPFGSLPSLGGNGDVLIFNRMASDNIAKQLSCSWYWNPDDPSTDDVFFKEFAAQGQSLFVASGDSGAYTSGSTWFPMEDTYVTAVGGTNLNTNLPGGPWSSETAWSQSGGGPSPNGFLIPSWQLGVANSSNGASSTLRNAPDVAMEANNDNYYCEMGVCESGGGGTSYAAPRWAAFMALVNEQAVAAGQSTVGFVNPALYSLGEGSNFSSDYHDIASGSNGTYSAVSGYDLVTGWGSPKGQSLIDALMPQLQPACKPPTNGCPKLMIWDRQDCECEYI